jgi:hypothetical protein
MDGWNNWSGRLRNTCGRRHSIVMLDLAMELFQIRCETCRARLRVSDARVLGQILACPKCGSMVEIAPPAGWVAPSEVVAALPLTAATTFSGSSSTLSAENAVQSSAPASKISGVLTRALHSTAVWCSAGGVATLAVVGVGASLAWRSNAVTVSPIAVAAATSDATLSAAPQLATRPAAGICQGLAAPMEEQSQINAADEEAAEKESTTNRSARAPEAAYALSDTLTMPRPTTSETSEVVQPAAQMERASEIIPASAASSPATSPRRLTLEPLPSDPAAANIAEVGLPRYSSSTDILETSDHSGESVAIATTQVAATQSARLRFGPSTQDVAHRTNIADQVSVPIKTFDVVDTPLGHVLDTLANMAAVPITVDPVVLSAAGVSPDAKVTVHAHDTTVGKLIGSILREHNLTCRVNDGALLVELRSGETN